MSNATKVTVSTVTPVYRGGEYLRALVNELEVIRDQWRTENKGIELSECIFVDDGSEDDSATILSDFAREKNWIRILSLSKNFGQHSATVAGVCHSVSDWVITMDEDMQHHPENFELLFRSQVENSSDLVYAKPISGSHGMTWRDKSSRLVKSAIGRLSSNPHVTEFNSFRLIRGSVARAAASSSTFQTYFDIALTWFTSSVSSIQFEMQDSRFVMNSDSGYNFIKLVAHARKLMLSSGLDVAAKGMVIGGVTIMIAILLGASSMIFKLVSPASIGQPGWVSLVVMLTLFSGVIISLLCLALEYIQTLLQSGIGKPTFFTVDRSNDGIIRDWIDELV